MKALKQNISQMISSRVIAKVTGKNHGDVMRDIREMCKQGNIIIYKSIQKQNCLDIDSQEVTVIETKTMIEIGTWSHRMVGEYLLNEMAANVLALGYDVKKRIAILKLVKEMRTALETLHSKVIPIGEAAKLYNMGINIFRGKLRYYGIFGQIKADYKQYNQPYLKYILDGSFVGNCPTRKIGMNLIQEVFRTGESLRESNTNPNLGNNVLVVLFEMQKASIDFILSNQSDHAQLAPQKQLALNNLINASKKAEEMINNLNLPVKKV